VPDGAGAPDLFDQGTRTLTYLDIYYLLEFVTSAHRIEFVRRNKKRFGHLPDCRSFGKAVNSFWRMFK